MHTFSLVWFIASAAISVISLILVCAEAEYRHDKDSPYKIFLTIFIVNLVIAIALSFLCFVVFPK
jgi:hypothetical protein